jgi:SAM-dependent methyltransferase
MARDFAISLGKYRFSLRISRQPGQSLSACRDRIVFGHAKTLERRFPELCDFGFSVTQQNAAEIGQFYADYIPLIHGASRSAHVRSLLSRLKNRTKDSSVKQAAMLAIAVSDLSDGLPDRAEILKDDPRHASAWDRHLDRFEAAYGTPLVRDDWSRASRGKSLVAYFDAHKDLLRGKAILHFAPEQELRAWFGGNCQPLGINKYVTADGFAPGVDQHHDITALDIPDQSFDVVICHRVMEHVLDDTSGFSELFRVLRPGGLLSFSVPQAPHQPETREWIVPDESHHGHVRHYGADLEARMRKAGFRVEIEPWLLKQPSDVLRSQNAYPMRIFNGWRENQKLPAGDNRT